MNKWVTFLLILLLAVGTTYAAPTPRDSQRDIRRYLAASPEAVKNISPFTEIPTSVGDLPQTPPRRDNLEPEGNVEIGDDFVIGYTFYDYQHNGSIGKMIARDTFGGVHFTWMCGYDAGLNTRHMLYNNLIDGELFNAPNERGRVDAGTKSGYGALWLLPEDQRALAFFHVVGYEGAPNPDYLATGMAVDWGPRAGVFQSYYPTPLPNIQAIWPKGAADRNNIVHVINHQYWGEGDVPLYAEVYYQRGVAQNEGYSVWEWMDLPVRVDTVSTISQVVATSMTSDRVALAWHHNRVGANLGPWDAVRGAYQRNNDIRYIISEDGENWDWQNGKRSITKIIPVNPELLPDRTKAYGDTLRPYCDVDIEFDPWNDELYASFAVSGFLEEPDPNADQVVEAAYAVHGGLWFWNSVEDTLTLIFDGWYYNNNLASGGFRPGGWRVNADRPSISFNPDEEGTIYVTWVHFPEMMAPIVDDLGRLVRWDFYNEAQDTSLSGYSNAEIMVSISTDFGITWREPVNVTQTIWEGERAPQVGECMSENWVSAALLADDTLHIQYVLDTDAGGIAQQEGAATNSPIIYQRIATADLPLNDPIEMPRARFMFHNPPEVRMVVPYVGRTPGAPTPDDEVLVKAEVVPGERADVETVYLLYRLNGGADTDTLLMEKADGDTFETTLPTMEAGTVVWYYVLAEDESEFQAANPDRRWYYAYVVRGEGDLTIRDVQYRPDDWVVDYSPYRGYEVTLTGTITTPASFNQQFGAYMIQDAEEAWSGIYVRGIEDALNVGDRITVTGTVMERDPNQQSKWAFATYIDTREYENLGQGQLINPVVVEGVGDISSSDGTMPEEWEAVLVKLYDFHVDTTTGSQRASGYLVIEDNTAKGWMTFLGIPAEDQGVFANWVEGTEVADMVGVMTENNGHYAVAPRTLDDLGAYKADEDHPTPREFRLEPAYPNPFNSMTSVAFELPASGWTHLALYDLSGRLVTDLLQSDLKAGRHELTVDASKLSAGVYMLRLESDTRTASQKLVLMK